MAERPWYERAFRADYLQVYAHRSGAQAAAQVAAMQKCGLLPLAGRVLDIACGAGRHLRAMRAAGLDACGLDFSFDLLKAGGLAGVAVRADMREIPIAAGVFDWACSVFTSFGYFDSAADDARMFSGAARVLKPGGRMVIDHINPGPTVHGLQPLTVEERDGAKITQRRSHDQRAALICKEIEYEHQGRTERWNERVRYYAPHALDDLLRGVGLKIINRFGDLDGSQWNEDTSPRQVILAQKA